MNRKPCCGVVAVGKTTLAPDEATDVVVTLSVGGRFGDVTHEAVVVTDDTPPQELVLRTVTQACPPLRVEVNVVPKGTVPKVLTLETDHPAMAKAEIPVVVIE